MGRLETFGSEGRLFSSGGDDYYLLSRQSYLTEDSGGYEGQIRVIVNYANGGYEQKMQDYIARCNAPFDGMVTVMIRESGEKDYDYNKSVRIISPGKLPDMSKKAAYNLYWAACHQQFRKFK